MSWPIYIKPIPCGSSRITFDPNPLPAAGQQGPVLGQGAGVYWSNLDDREHWPGLQDGKGNIINKEYFMKQPVGAKDSGLPTSEEFLPQSGGTYYYKCSIPGHENETGSFTFSSQ